jgi:hypothetical protein
MFHLIPAKQALFALSGAKQNTKNDNFQTPLWHHEQRENTQNMHLENLLTTAIRFESKLNLRMFVNGQRGINTIYDTYHFLT